MWRRHGNGVHEAISIADLQQPPANHALYPAFVIPWHGGPPHAIADHFQVGNQIREVSRLMLVAAPRIYVMLTVVACANMTCGRRSTVAITSRWRGPVSQSCRRRVEWRAGRT